MLIFQIMKPIGRMIPTNAPTPRYRFPSPLVARRKKEKEFVRIELRVRRDNYTHKSGGKSSFTISGISFRSQSNKN